jgi:hypothetical protein
LNVGFHETPVTFQLPIGSGSLVLPTVTGACISTFPVASRTVSDFVAPETTTSTPAGAAGFAVAAGFAPGAGFAVAAGFSAFEGSSNGATSGTLIVSPAAHVAPGFNVRISAGLA